MPVSLSHPASHSGLRKAILFPCKKKVGSLALGCLLSPSPILLTAGEEPWRLVWKHLTHAAWTAWSPGSWSPGMLMIGGENWAMIH